MRNDDICRAANYIGYLPGEVINQSILHLLHPYDMAQIKQIHATCKSKFVENCYKSIVKTQYER